MKHKLFLIIALNLTILSILHGQGVVVGGSMVPPSNQKKDIIIKGTVKGFADNTKVTLAHGSTGAVLETAFIKNEKFILTVPPKDTLLAGVYIGTNEANEFTVLFLEDQDIQINGEKGAIKYSKVTGGGPINKEYKLFLEATEPYLRKREELNDQLLALYQIERDTTSAEFRALSKQVSEYIWKPHEYALKKLKEKPGHYWSLISLQNAMPLMKIDEVAKYFQLLDEDLKKHPLAKSIEARINANQVKIGKKAPNFELVSLAGDKVRLSDFKGQYVLIDFWASWCGPCRVENRNLVPLYKEFKDQGFEIISVSTDVNKEFWAKASKKDGIIWKDVIDNNVQQTSTDYNVLLIPTSFLIDPSGKVIEKNLKGEALLNKLKSIYSDEQ